MDMDDTDIGVQKTWWQSQDTAKEAWQVNLIRGSQEGEREGQLASASDTIDNTKTLEMLIF